ncbi:unnamed protein product [Malus baccata var. baccata]
MGNDNWALVNHFLRDDLILASLRGIQNSLENDSLQIVIAFLDGSLNTSLVKPNVEDSNFMLSTITDSLEVTLPTYADKRMVSPTI